ncbi:MAG: hypothetical protein AB7J19_19105, partial [Beijerinckiaceae bacterium]
MPRKLSVSHDVQFSLPRIGRNGATRAKAKGADHLLAETILAQWKQQLPELNFEPMELIAALTQAYHLTSIPIDQMMAKYNLTRGMFDVLAALRRSGKPYELTPKE